jgi:hypothetical protein
MLLHNRHGLAKALLTKYKNLQCITLLSIPTFERKGHNQNFYPYGSRMRKLFFYTPPPPPSQQHYSGTYQEVTYD